MQPFGGELPGTLDGDDGLARAGPAAHDRARVGRHPPRRANLVVRQLDEARLDARQVAAQAEGGVDIGPEDLPGALDVGPRRAACRCGRASAWYTSTQWRWSAPM